MQNTNVGVIVIVALAALALIIFLAIRNRKDKKELLPPEKTDDPVKEVIKDQQRKQDKI